jgi:2-dehydro-3-deoxygluconokinase
MSTPATPPRLVTLGETLGVVASSLAGEWQSGTNARLAIAGSESNVAIGVCRLGARATWIGHVGNDAFGRLIIRELTAEGVDVRATRHDVPTGLLLREQRTADRARVTYHRTASAGSRLSPDDVAPDILDGAALLHITGITPALGEQPAAAVARIVEIAASKGIPISFDVNYRANLWSRDDAANALAPLLAKATIVFASEHEASLFTDHEKPADMARALHYAGPATAIIKRGGNGSHAYAGGEDFRREALNVTAVDTVGAGDAFAAGYLADFMNGAHTAQCLDTATVTAAFAVSTLGDWEGLPRRNELALLSTLDDTIR